MAMPPIRARLVEEDLASAEGRVEVKAAGLRVDEPDRPGTDVVPAQTPRDIASALAKDVSKDWMPDVPYLKITISGSDGSESEKLIGPPVILRVLPEIPAKIAAMYVTARLFSELKNVNFQDALKAIGLK